MPQVRGGKLNVSASSLRRVLDSVLPIVVPIGADLRSLFHAYFVGFDPGAALLSRLSALDIVAERTHHRLGRA